MNYLKTIINIPFSIVHRLKMKRFSRMFASFGFQSGIGTYGYGDDCFIRGHEHISVGNKSWIGPGTSINAILLSSDENFMPTIRIGDNVHATSRLKINCFKSVCIEDNVLIAPDVFITDGNHGMNPMNEAGYSNQNVIVQPVKIMNGVWLCLGSCVLPGVTIGAHSIIGANSVVTHDIPEYCIAVGAPAKVIKKWNFERERWERIG